VSTLGRVPDRLPDLSQGEGAADRVRYGAMRSRFLDWQGPIPFAHRGGAGDHPENTMAAFRAAVAMGYRHLETDVHLTRDGAVVGDRLRRFRALAGDGVCTSMGPRAITRARLSSLTGRIPRQGALCIQLPVRQSGIPMVEPLMIRAAHRSGLAVHVWTIDDGAEMERLLDLGVDGIMTDTLDTLRGVLRRRGAWHEDAAAP